jgi:hypothetical protein
VAAAVELAYDLAAALDLSMLIVLVFCVGVDLLVLFAVLKVKRLPLLINYGL